MAIEEGPKDPARTRLEAIIACRAKRVSRAYDKLSAATLEDSTARAALEQALADLDQWISDNPDPQPNLL